MNILIGNYNNYYNRQVKVPGIGELEDYEDAMEAVDNRPLPLTYENINFNPNDGITTELILGKGNNLETSIINGPDYLVAYGSDEAIDSRWFILESNRTRGGQWKLTLRRDVLVDFKDAVDTAPIYVQKAIINDVTNPLLCNNEGLVVNQIKKDEIGLYDRTKCPWLVMYLKKGVLGSTSIGTSGKVTIDVPENDADVYETLTTPIGNWSMATYESTDYKVMESPKFIVFWTRTNTVNDYRYLCNATESSADYITGAHYTTNLTAPYTNTSSTFKAMLNQYYKDHYSTLYTKLSNDQGLGTYDGIWKYNNKIIKDSTGKYYKITVYENSKLPIGTAFLDGTNYPTLKTQMQTLWNNMLDISVTANDTAFGLKGTLYKYRLRMDEVTSIETVVDFSAYTGTGATDSMLYDVIAMPYGDVKSWGSGGLIDVDSTAERSLRVMNSLARNLGTSYVLDLQLLPYCPVQELINPSIDARMSIKYLHDQCLTGEYDSSYTDIIYVPTTINSEFNITKGITISDSSAVPDTFKKKYVNDCTMIRLCSPNYNGVFEMNLAKNGMSINRFNVDVTLKPQTPYIHVNPNFKDLYEKDYNDARGLICGGDFSLGLISDAWIEYEIQNKNYQNIFDRSIQNMDRNNSINMQEAMFQAAAGTVQGAGTGATAGFMAGGGYGAAAGAIIGAATAGVGGVMDVANLQARQKETKSYAIDNYNLQLGNVKALPYGITRTSALTYNNKLVPFIEIYECTEEEKEAYYLKLKYDGMTVGKIDYLPAYEGGDNFFKGQVIRLPDLLDDNHVAQAINEEIMKGVYI